MKGKTLQKIINTPKAGLKELSSLPTNEDFTVEIISKESGKKYIVSTDTLGSGEGGGGTSALFPNGIELVSVSRYFQASDAGKLLILSEDGVEMSMPEIFPFQDNDILYVKPSGLESKFQFKYQDNYFEGLNSGNGQFEVLKLGAINQGIIILSEAALLYDKTALRYLYDQSQNAIPLSGTEVGKPVTGDIEFKSGYDAVRLYKTNEDEDIVQSIYFNDSHLEIKGTNIANTQNASIKLYADNVTIEGTGIGLRGGIDFTLNITDLDYTQKIYVDNQITSLDYGDIATVGGVQNIQIYTTGTGTGTASVDLLPTIQIGKDITVSDLGNNAGTHNIQIDSGVGNTILVAGSSPSQDITLNTNGASVTIRKMTATQFMVIAKN